MENFKDILITQARSHPSFRPADAVKLCYQATFGAEHLLTDKERARNYFFSEYESVDASDVPLLECISEDYCRANLSAVKSLGISPETVFEAFFLTANEKSGNAEEELLERLGVVSELSKSEYLPFSYDEFEAFLSEYKAIGGGPVHHSEEYRKAEHPAYRVIAKKYTYSFLKETNNE